MERLTMRYEGGKTNYLKYNGGTITDYHYQHGIDRLAEYEDIGTPQELAELKTENEVLKMSKDAIESAFINASMNLGMLSEITADISLDRLKEICEEERTAEYSSYQILDYARERAYIITRNGMNFEAIQGENACERAEARLKELRNKKWK